VFYIERFYCCFFLKNSGFTFHLFFFIFSEKKIFIEKKV